MKYSSEDLNGMSYLEWMETICKELNEAGFKDEGFCPEKHRFVKNYSPYEVRDVRNFFMGSINDGDAMDYLKTIGLVDNGRCPMCGAQIKGTPSRYTYGPNPRLNFHICSSCRKEGEGISIYHSGSGCIIALILLPWHLLKNMFTSIF